jgi:hypothetical protein
MDALAGRAVSIERLAPLKAFCTCQTRIARLAAGLMGLGLCVFLWGLQYKLSLYDPPQSISHKIPTAKLLSRDEQSATNEATLIAKSIVSEKEMQLVAFCLTLPILIAFNLLYQAILVRLHMDVRQRWRLRPDICLNAFSFRPPPISA